MAMLGRTADIVNGGRILAGCGQKIAHLNSLYNNSCATTKGVN
jgi:hypothetical protein